MNFCYALNFSKFSNIFNDNIDVTKYILDKVPDNRKKNKHLFYAQPTDIFKESFLKLLPVDVSVCHYFYKTSGGGIHVDIPQYDPNNPEDMWGINWNFGEPGIYEFWDYSDITSVSEFVNEESRTHPVLTTNRMPRKSYRHKTGPILFNASFPHRVVLSNSLPKFSVSLRMAPPVISWKDAISKFSNFIIDDANILESI